MDSTIYSELVALRAELRAVTNNLTSLEGRLDEVTRRAETENSELITRVQQLQTDNHEAVNTSRWLREQIQELERRIELHKPEVEQAVQAREDAIRRLRHSRRVIKDLLNERTLELDKSPIERSEILVLAGLSLEEGNVSSTTASGKTSSRSSSSAYSDRTARPGIQPPFPEQDSGSSSQIEASHSPSNNRQDVISPSETSTRRSIEGDQVSRRRRIQYSKPPKSALVRIPIRDPLDRYLRLDEDTAFALESLVSQGAGMSLRLEIKDNYAFVYDPILLESVEETFIVDWAPTQMNRRMVEYIAQAASPLHTFTFPINKGRWFYVGAHTWNVVQLRPIWPTLLDESRQKLANKLKERVGADSLEEIVQALDKGTLQQLSIRISSTGLGEMTDALVLQLQS